MSSPLRAWSRSRETVLSMEVLAKSAPAEQAQPTQFRTLVRNFLERFFTSEMASTEGDAKARLVQVACALGVPGLVAALYLYPLYHLPRGRVGKYFGPRPYWGQVGDHYFYVLYSMVAMALLTIFEWDLLFPDLLDVFVLSTLPVSSARAFRARVTAIFVLMGAALFDANFLAPLVLPAATDPPHLLRFLAAHGLAVGAAGIFGSAFFLGIEGTLLALLGDRFFRRMALWLQGFFVVALLTMLFLYPALAGALAGLLQSGSRWTMWLPPLWFLGIEQRILDGASTPAVFATLAHIGALATLSAAALAIASYPLAWWRRTKDLIEGAVRRDGQNIIAMPAHRALHSTVARAPGFRAVWHFIGQNLLRVPRYRMVLVMYGGAGAALVIASISRVTLLHGRVGFEFSPDGLRAIVPILAFWTVSGLRSTFLAPADQRGRWIFRAVLGKPGPEQLNAAERWVFLSSAILCLAAVAFAIVAVPAAQRDARFIAMQLVAAIGLCALLTDAFFLNVKTIPFTGARSSSATNFALLLIPYLGFFPAIVFFTVGMEPSLESSWQRILAAATVAAVAHLCLRLIRRARIAEHLQQIECDEDEEEFPMRLGLRY